MTLPLFAPAAPDAQPDYTAQPLGKIFHNGPCGKCRAIPKHFRIDVHQVFTGIEGIDSLESNLMGTWILTRRQPSLTEGPSPLLFTTCCFLSRPVDTTPFYTHDIGDVPGDVTLDTPLSPLSLWRLHYESPGDGQWWLQAGAFWWHNAPRPPGPPDHGTGFVWTGNDVGRYAAVRFHQPTVFRCRFPNVFTRFDGVFQGSYEPTITVRPFWP